MTRAVHRFRNGLTALLLTGLLAISTMVSTAFAQSQDPGNETRDSNAVAVTDQNSAYTSDEVLDAGHTFFGGVSQDLAKAIEHVFSNYGQPNGYILGEEGSGAIVVGLRYGEGTLYTRDKGNHRVYWQGPSLGWDFGGDGGRTMILVYNLNSTDDIYNYYVGVNGSAYLIGGVGLTVLSHNNVLAAPIRSGVGLRLGVNVGYLKFTRKPTWNPF